MQVGKLSPHQFPSVFLSYARDDDKEFVKRLHGHLKEAGFRVWWDRVSMPGRALTFHQEIRDAIEAHDRTMVILGPKAVESEYVRAEWQYALAADKIVSPVLRLGGYDIMPAELKSLHCVNAVAGRDETETIAEVLRIAKDPPPPVGRPYHVPGPPPHFQPRVDQFTRLSSWFVLDDAQRIALPSSRRTLVLQGMAGLGKSVLAASLGKATAVRRVFPDGVIWLIFSAEERSPLMQLRTLGLALGDDPRRYDTEQQATESVRQRLDELAVLLVLDNIWWDELVHPFYNALGRRCQMLTTTRDAGLATRLGAKLVPLELLSEEESSRLLADWAETSPDALPAAALTVADECNRLPFALALVGAMAAGGSAWEDLAERLKAADLGFVKTKFPNYPYADLLRAQQASLETLLQSEDPDLTRASEKYLELSAFRWEHPVPEAAIATRWIGSEGLSEQEARKTLTTLASKALLRLEGTSPQRHVFLHDLQQDFLIARVPDQAAEHAAILDAYANRHPGAPLAAADDGYYHDSLFHHLEHAGRSAAMHALLRREDGEKRNAWWQARTAKGQALGYEADLRRAWADAARMVPANTSDPIATGIALLARYALMIGSIHDALSEVPRSLVQSLVAHNLWTPEQALAAARWQLGNTSRAEGLALVLPWLEGARKQQVADDALAIIATFPEAGDRARTLLRVAEGVEGEQRLRILREVVELTRKDIPGNRVEYLKTAWTLHPSSIEWLEQAIDELESLEEGTRYNVKSLALATPESHLARLIPIARGLNDDEARASALLTIAAASPQQDRAALAAEGCEHARHSTSLHIRLEHLGRGARWLTGEMRAKIVGEVRTGLDELEPSERALPTLAAIAPVLKGVQRTRVEKALAKGIAKLRSASTVSSIAKEFGTPGGLDETAPASVQSLIEPLIEAARRQVNSYSRAQALSDLVPFIAPARMSQLLAEEVVRAQLIDDQWDRARCLTVLSERLEDPARTAVVERLLSLPAVRNASLGLYPELSSLMRMATPDQLGRAREDTSPVRDASELAAAFAIGFAHHGLWKRVYEELDQIVGPYYLGLALKGFPEHVPPKVARQIIDASIASRNAELSAAAIPPLIRHLKGEQKEQRLQIALQALDVLSNRRDRTELAHKLLPEFPCDMVENVRAELVDKPSGFEKSPNELRSRLALRLLQCGRATDMFSMLEEIKNADNLAPVLAEIAEIAGPLKARFSEWAEVVAEKAWTDQAAETLVRLASSCEEAERNRLLQKASAIASSISVDDEKQSVIDRKELKARALLHVAPFLPNGQQRELLLEAWRLAPKGGAFMGQRVLEDLSPYLARLAPSDLLGPWQEDLTAASRHRAAVLQELAALPDVLERLGDSDALLEIVTAVEDVARWWPDTD